ncbi:hypothetical protein BU15DRAFT_72247 [Melanogaster broomeanus]|nr:hypothetical protein BU15DRAFT_72247 [Melanogaster broomeanus]
MSNSSADSQSSARSLCSQGIVNPAQVQAPARSHKQPAIWTEDQEAALLIVLLDNISAAGDGGFKLVTFNTAVSHLNTKFPGQTGGLKLKKLYKIVVDLKSASGFTWSEQGGAGITLESNSNWASYCKSHPGAKSYIVVIFQKIPLECRVIHGVGIMPTDEIMECT